MFKELTQKFNDLLIKQQILPQLFQIKKANQYVFVQ